MENCQVKEYSGFSTNEAAFRLHLWHKNLFLKKLIWGYTYNGGEWYVKQKHKRYACLHELIVEKILQLFLLYPFFHYEPNILSIIQTVFLLK